MSYKFNPFTGTLDIVSSGSSSSGVTSSSVTSVDNSIARFDGVTGQVIQNSGVVIDDSSNIWTNGQVGIAGSSSSPTITLLYSSTNNCSVLGLPTANPTLLLANQANSGINYGLSALGLIDPFVVLTPASGNKNHVAYFGLVESAESFLFSGGGGDGLDGTTYDANGITVRYAAGAGGTKTTGGYGGAAWLYGGAAGGSGNNDGGGVRLFCGAPTGSGVYGTIWLNGSLRFQFQTATNDTNFAITTNDYYVKYQVITATRTLTLPVSVQSGTMIEVHDNSGSVSTTVNMNVITSDGTTIDGASGATGKNVTTAYGSAKYVKGTSNWFTVRGDMSSQYANAVSISGGTINGTTVGATTAATGKFTTLTATARIIGASVAITAANDQTLGAGNLNIVAGNTQITAIITASWVAGSHVTLIFSGTPTVKHNTAGGAGTARIFLAGSGDFVAAANSVLGLVYDGTQWQETFRKIA